MAEAREKARTDRALGQARAQFDLVHARGLYDLEVDTSTLSARECALRIKARLEDGATPSALRLLKEEQKTADGTTPDGAEPHSNQ